MKHRDHTHTTAAEARTCEAQLRGTTPITAPQATRTETASRLMRAHSSSAILANLSGLEYRPITPQAAQRQDAKYARMNRTPGKATQQINRAVAASTRDGMAAAAAFVARPAHPKRLDFAAKLIEERDTNLISLAASEVMMNVMDRKAISAGEIGLLIDDLLAAPKKDRPGTRPAQPQAQAQGKRSDGIRELAAPLPDQGYYALHTAGTEDEIHFYRITRNERGYLKVQEQASDELYPVRWQAVRGIVQAILDAGIASAQALYADKLDKCYRCGRTLTDATSRALGIGPDCRAK